MKILILTFSPAGSTQKVSKILEQKLAAKGHTIQSIDITRDRSIFHDNNPQKLFTDTIKPHDVLCIGSPVYEKHLEFYVDRFMKQLPKPDSIWGIHAVPFVTHGGISSGTALQQSISILKKSGRNPVAAMKIECAHIKCDKLKTRVNEQMPGDEAIPLIDELVKKIDGIKMDQKQKSLNTKDLACHGFKERLMCALMNEQKMHRSVYPQFKILEEKCNNCLSCVRACSIQRIETIDGKPEMNGTKPECIHCFSCVNVCPNDAITFVTEAEGWAKIDRIYGMVSKKDSFIRSDEKPMSAVYPRN